MSVRSDLDAQVRAFANDDPDDETRAELIALLEAGDEAELDRRFHEPLRFGTAGVRATYGAGESRVNAKTARSIALGVGHHALTHVRNAAARGIVVAYDARLPSASLADHIAVALTSIGIRIFAFRDPVPTPLAAFAMRRLGAAAGLVVTASHNPKEDAGIKVFGSDGAQITPPADAQIGIEIAAAGAVRDLVRDTTLETDVPPGIEREYIASIVDRLEAEAPRAPLRVAYSAMHGVGAHLFEATLERARLPIELIPVSEQHAPDGSFPTAPKPNPEHPEALSLLHALAAEHQVDLAIAHDPDADRLAVSIPGPEGFVRLHGNDIGCLLADDLLARDEGPGRPCVIRTLVSSPMLDAIAAYHGANCDITLTGHKWIHRRAMEREAQGARFVFGFEEALGYAVGSAVRDKDGISAAIAFLDASARWKAEDRTVDAALSSLRERFGVWISGQRTRPIQATNSHQRRAVLEAILARAPESLAGRRIIATLDGIHGERRSIETNTTLPLGLPRANIIGFEMSGGSRLLVRPSGTEPKLKIYADIRFDRVPARGADAELDGVFEAFEAAMGDALPSARAAER